MALNNNALPNLSRYSVGEIVDLSGVTDFYNAGSSKWLRSGVATASSNLNTTTKTNLANAGTSTAQTVLVQSALSSSYNVNGFHATYPIARISASSVSVVPGYQDGSYDVIVGAVTSAGLQPVATGQTSIRASGDTTGSNVFVQSNNTTIFSYTFTSATALSAYSTTNGTTWTSNSVTGLPVFSAQPTTISHASQSVSGNAYTCAGMTGWKRNSSAGSEFAVFWCGARFVLIGPGTGVTSYVASLSSNGFTFGGDNTTAVLGSAVIAVAERIQFYRNGNNCYLQVGANNKRYTTDGGITWAASTFAATPDPANYYMQYNTTDPAKLIIMGGTSSSLAYYTADSGATWSANRALPNTASEGGLWYKGSTVVFGTGGSQGINKVSTDNGATYTNISFPIGILGTDMYFSADANRFYAGVQGQKQLLTSSDGVTWTIVTLSQTYSLTASSTNFGYGIITYSGDSNTVVLLGKSSASGTNQCIFSLDGGVTWTGSQYTVGAISGNWNVGNAFSTPDAGGICFAWGSAGYQSGQNTPVFKSDITSGGAFYRTGTTAITPIRTNALSFVRVA